MHHIFVNENAVNIVDRVIAINGDQDFDNYNHLVKSLRINVGEQVLCSVFPFEFSFDYLCEVKDITDKEVKLYILEETKQRELVVKVNLYQGISKSDKFEFIIEKAVELGVSSIIPLATEYCVAKIDDKKSDKKIERFNKISKSAAEQSKRHIIPEVLVPISFDEFIDSINENDENTYNLLFYENANGIAETKRVLTEIKNKDNKDVIINLIIGPEGGFSNAEIEKAKNKKVSILSLGERILRTETAAVTAMSIVMYEVGE